MKHLKGIPVILIQRTETGKDPFDHPIYEEKEITAENVLVSPTSSDDVLSTTNLYGRKAVYALGTPKGGRRTWEDNKVKFFGQTFRMFGEDTRGIDNLVPLEWNKKVWVEVYEWF